MLRSVLAATALAGAGVLFVSPVFSPQALAADAVFPKPDPAKTFASLKVYDASGSPLRIPREDWDGARQRVKRADWAEWIAGERATMDGWIEKRRDHVEWQAGWYHDFTSPKDGSTLLWTPDEPGQFTLRSESDRRVELPVSRRAWQLSRELRPSVSPDRREKVCGLGGRTAGFLRR
ncbi:MAG: hypothetical protein V4671_29495 [Armatimonadota bacterium]